jgi:hypothetical protein
MSLILVLKHDGSGEELKGAVEVRVYESIAKLQRDAFTKNSNYSNKFTLDIDNLYFKQIDFLKSIQDKFVLTGHSSVEDSSNGYCALTVEKPPENFVGAVCMYLTLGLYQDKQDSCGCKK